MSTLIVNTLPNHNYIAVFVASQEGRPALGLGPANFSLRSAIPGADGAQLTISAVMAATLRGFYVLDLAPARWPPQRKGVYVFDLIVEHGKDRGQAFSSVIMT